jgi:hypothetical protein
MSPGACRPNAASLILVPDARRHLRPCAARLRTVLAARGHTPGRAAGGLTFALGQASAEETSRPLHDEHHDQRGSHGKKF